MCDPRTVSAYMLVFAACAWQPASAQTVVLSENFENGSNAAGPVQRVSAYVGTAGTTYTADPSWLTLCNGWVARWDHPLAPAAQVTDCNGQLSWNAAQTLGQALGQLNGQTQAAARSNTAVSAYTAGDPGANLREIQSSQAALTGIPAGGVGRFVTFRIDVAADSCQASAPLLNFFLLTPANTEISVGGTVDGCAITTTFPVEARGLSAARNVRAARYLAPGTLLYTAGTTLAVRVRNAQGTGSGNDHAFDNLQILDVTPRLLKSATPLTYVGQPKPLTFTVTNTPGDNLTKTGWGFTDTLPFGVRVATPNGLANTCGGTVTATAGAGTISIANGSLPAGTAGGAASTCTITVNVVSNTAGTYSNGAGNIGTSLGLNLPTTPAAMEWVNNRLTITKISNATTGAFQFAGNNGAATQTITTTAAGAPGTAGAQQTLTSASITANTVVTETPPAGWSITAAACTGLAAGQSAAFTATTVTLPFAGLPLQSGGRDIACTVTNTLSGDLSITKTNTPGVNGEVDQATDSVVRGTSTTYSIVARNNGAGTIAGAVVTDPAPTNESCNTPVPCAGVACPGATVPLADLQGTGVVLGPLASGATATFTPTCAVQ